MCMSGSRPERLSEACRSMTFGGAIDKPTVPDAWHESHQMLAFSMCMSGGRPERLSEACRSMTFGGAIDKPTVPDARLENNLMTSFAMCMSGGRPERLSEARRSMTFGGAIDKPTRPDAGPESYCTLALGTYIPGKHSGETVRNRTIDNIRSSIHKANPARRRTRKPSDDCRHSARTSRGGALSRETVR